MAADDPRPKAEREEWLQIFESTLEFPGGAIRSVRVPQPEFFPPGSLATGYVDQELIERGILAPDELYPNTEDEEDNTRLANDWERKWAPPRSRRRWNCCSATSTRTSTTSGSGRCGAPATCSTTAADFDAFVTARGLQKQEGCVFRHCLRLVLLCGEFARLTPDGLDAGQWRGELKEVARALTLACRAVDPRTTEAELETLTAGDDGDDFGSGLFE